MWMRGQDWGSPPISLGGGQAGGRAQCRGEVFGVFLGKWTGVAEVSWGQAHGGPSQLSVRLRLRS